MVTKAIIEDIDDIYSVKVRIPMYDSTPEFTDSTKTADLSSAIICTLPQTSYVPAVGDIVLVAFEDNDKGKPVIIGCLFKESGNLSGVDIKANNLKVSGNFTIGSISYDQLKYLEGLEQNIQNTLDNLEDRISKLEETINV